MKPRKAEDVWTYDMHKRAEKEGWNLYDGPVGIEVRPSGSLAFPKQFESVNAVWVHIVWSACTGSKFHHDVLLFLKEFSPAEMNRITQFFNDMIREVFSIVNSDEVAE